MNKKLITFGIIGLLFVTLVVGQIVANNSPVSSTNQTRIESGLYHDHAYVSNLLEGRDFDDAVKQRATTWKSEKEDAGYIVELRSVRILDIKSYEDETNQVKIEIDATLTQTIRESNVTNQEEYDSLINKSYDFGFNGLFGGDEEPVLNVYTCEANNQTRTDCLSFSSGLKTRCYLNEEKTSWAYCSSGWVN